VPARIVAVLPFEADGRERLYAPAAFAFAVETYRQGLAVPEFGWPGGAPTPPLSFDGLIAVLDEPLAPLERARLRIGTGFSSVEDLAGDRLQELLGVPLPTGRAALLLRIQGSVARLDNVDRVREKLRGRSALLLPYVEPLVAELDGRPARLVGLSLGLAEAERLGVPASPWGAFDPGRSGAAILAVTLSEAGPAKVTAHVQAGGAVLDLPLAVAGTAAVPTVPLELAGALRTGAEQRLEFDRQRGELLLTRDGYKGFRLYASSIDQVPGLYRDLRDAGLQVDAKVQEIERIQMLDRGLLSLFLLIAVVGVLGGMGAMIASLYAAVERKKRELGVLRLMGLSRRAVSRFPVVQGLVVAALGVLVAAAVYGLVARVIDRTFAGEVAGQGSLCQLPPAYYAYVAAFALTGALLSATVAAWRATRIEPAEAIREE